MGRCEVVRVGAAVEEVCDSPMLVMVAVSWPSAHASRQMNSAAVLNMMRSAERC